jgi:hypothetical protein
VVAAKYTGVPRQRGDDVLDDVGFAGRSRFVVGDVDAVTTDEPDPKHNARHAPHTRPTSERMWSAIGQPTAGAVQGLRRAVGSDR